MKKKFLVVLSIILAVSLLVGCAELFDVNTVVERNPFVPTEGTPIPAPNAPLLKTQAPETPEPSEIPDPTDTPTPITSTNPIPVPTATAVPTTAPTAAPTLIPTQVPTPEPTLEPTPEPTLEPTPEPTLIPPDILSKIGMLSDYSDNTSYALSSLAWSGLESAALDFGYEPVIMELPAVDDGTILAHIELLVSAKCELIVLPGYRFESALIQAQLIYPEIYFVLIESNSILSDTVATVIFDEVQAGFLAGVAASIELSSILGYETTDFGIIIGEDTLSIQRYSDGFQQGLTYAEMKYGIDVRLDPQFLTYLPVQNDPEGAFLIAWGLYDSGVSCILNLAGTSASGVIDSAIDANSNGIPSYVVSVDYDQFTEGISEGQTSVVLTSAIKYYDTAVYDLVGLYTKDIFPGRSSLTYDLANKGVGLSISNPIFSPATKTIISEVSLLLNNGMISLSPLTILSTPPIPAP